MTYKGKPVIKKRISRVECSKKAKRHKINERGKRDAGSEHRDAKRRPLLAKLIMLITAVQTLPITLSGTLLINGGGWVVALSPPKSLASLVLNPLAKQKPFSNTSLYPVNK